MAGIGYYNIEEIPKISEQTKIIVMGTVLGVFQQEQFLTIIINDTTSSAEATLYQQRLQYSQLPIPKLGETIQILGTCSTKPMAHQKNKLFLKIKIQRYRKISFKQQISILQRILISRRKRVQNQLTEESFILRKKIVIKQKHFSQKQMIDIRSLILSYLYIVLISNGDINSYLFNPISVFNHRISKEYAKDKQIPQKSLEQAIKRGLKQLKQNQVVQIKNIQSSNASVNVTPSKPNIKPVQNEKQKYVIKKSYFQRLIVQIQLFINQRQFSGVTLEQVTAKLNQKLGRHQQDQYLFNSKFVQKMLIDLINQGKLYKTSEKKLYPTNR